MAKCAACGGTTILEVLPEYKDELMGVPITLVGAVTQKVCNQCKAVVSTKIPDQEGLVAAIAISRVIDPLKLNGQEIRFLRKALNYTGKYFAMSLEVTPETVSRWENDKEVIGPTSEKLLRLVVGSILAEKAPAIDCNLDEIVNMRIQSARLHKEPEPMRFERVKYKMPKKPGVDQWGALSEAA